MALQNIFADPSFLANYVRAAPKYGNMLRLFMDAMAAEEEKQSRIVAQRQEQRNQLWRDFDAQNRGY